MKTLKSNFLTLGTKLLSFSGHHAATHFEMEKSETNILRITDRRLSSTFYLHTIIKHQVKNDSYAILLTIQKK